MLFPPEWIIIQTLCSSFGADIVPPEPGVHHHTHVSPARVASYREVQISMTFHCLNLQGTHDFKLSLRIGTIYKATLVKVPHINCTCCTYRCTFPVDMVWLEQNVLLHYQAVLGPQGPTKKRTGPSLWGIWLGPQNNQLWETQSHPSCNVHPPSCKKYINF